MPDVLNRGFEVKCLTVDFLPTRLADQVKRLRDPQHGVVRALHNVCLRIEPGQAVGLLGESGCGKSTLARHMMGLISNDSAESQILFNGELLKDLIRRDETEFRKTVQMIFQHPDTFLNPRLLAKDMIMEAFEIRGECKKDIRSGKFDKELHEALDTLGLTIEDLEKTSEQLSGGEKKRMSILRVILSKPRFVIADEPFSGLDVSYRNRILKQFELLKESGVGFLLISHDFNVTKSFCDDICVMYKGQIVQQYKNPASGVPEATHPYTEVLIAANEYLSRCNDPLPQIMSKFKPELGQRDWRHAGCPFEDRCIYSDDVEMTQKCKQDTPEVRRDLTGNEMRCHRYVELEKVQ